MELEIDKKLASEKSRVEKLKSLLKTEDLLNNRTYTDVMVDLETLDTKATAVIGSIAAVAFNLEDPSIVMQKFEVGLTIVGQTSMGRTISEETFMWWEKQDKQVREKAFGGESILNDALTGLIIFIGMNCDPAHVRVWSKVNAMDIAILRHAVGKVQLPWKYNNERDTISYCMHYPYSMTDKSRSTHIAVEDCLLQISQVQQMFQFLKRRGIV